MARFPAVRGLITLLLAVCLFAGLVNGSALHAAELASFGEVTAATQWLHADGDHDEVPADADKNYPHHHNSCHGHELGALMKLGLACHLESRAPMPKPAAHPALAAGPPFRTLRPPIA